MAMRCNRSPFEMEDGCPPLKVDLNFPSFEACVSADPSKLKAPSRLDTNKGIAYPIIPANDPLPIQIPDIDFDDIGCPLDGINGDGDNITITGTDKASGKVSVKRTTEGCSMTGIDISLELPSMDGPAVRVEDGAVFYTFSASVSGWY